MSVKGSAANFQFLQSYDERPCSEFKIGFLAKAAMFQTAVYEDDNMQIIRCRGHNNIMSRDDDLKILGHIPQ